MSRDNNALRIRLEVSIIPVKNVYGKRPANYVVPYIIQPGPAESGKTTA